MRLNPVSGATLLALAALSLPGRAAGLGEARALSALGSPLRAEIALTGHEAIDVNCLRLRAAQAEGLPALAGARLALRQKDGAASLLLTTSRPVAEPILAFVVEDACGRLAAREYALFLDPPLAGRSASITASEPAVSAPADPPRARGERRAAAEWEMVAGESLASLAEALYPGQRAMQQRFVAAVRRDNPALADADPTAPLAAGTRLRVPQLRHVAAAPATTADSAGAPPAAVARRATAAARRGEPAPAAPARSGAQLRIESAPQEVIRELVAREKAAGVNVVDTDPVPGDSPLLAINRKIAELELIEAQLRAQIAEIDAKIAMTQAQIAARDAAAAVARPAVAAAPTVPAAPAGPPMWATLMLGGLIAIVGMGVGVAAAMLLRRRSAGAATSRGAVATASVASAAVPAAHRPETASHSHGERVHTHADDDPGGIEVADLNFVLGLHEGGEGRPETAATKVLARYLEAKGLRTSVPWLALLDGFRGANLREEYESLAQRIRGNYNVQVPNWDEPAEEAEAHHAERAPLEDYPHLVRRVTASWGSDLCLDFLDSLLQDNRNGTRKGFPMPVLGDILMLISIAEARRENGPPEPRASAVVRPLRRASS